MDQPPGIWRVLVGTLLLAWYAEHSVNTVSRRLRNCNLHSFEAFPSHERTNEETLLKKYTRRNMFHLNQR